MRSITYVGETLAAVEAHSLQTTVTKHLDDLGVLLAVLLEGQLSALVIVLLGTSSAVLTTLLHEEVTSAKVLSSSRGEKLGARDASSWWGRG